MASDDGVDATVATAVVATLLDSAVTAHEAEKRVEESVVAAAVAETGNEDVKDNSETEAEVAAEDDGRDEASRPNLNPEASEFKMLNPEASEFKMLNPEASEFKMLNVDAPEFTSPNLGPSLPPVDAGDISTIQHPASAQLNAQAAAYTPSPSLEPSSAPGAMNVGAEGFEFVPAGSAVVSPAMVGVAPEQYATGVGYDPNVVATGGLLAAQMMNVDATEFQPHPEAQMMNVDATETAMNPEAPEFKIDGDALTSAGTST